MHLYAFVKKIRVQFCGRAHSIHWLGQEGVFVYCVCPVLCYTLAFHNTEASGLRKELFPKAIVPCSPFQLRNSLQGGHTMFFVIQYCIHDFTQQGAIAKLCPSLSDLTVLKLILWYSSILSHLSHCALSLF